VFSEYCVPLAVAFTVTVTIATAMMPLQFIHAPTTHSSTGKIFDNILDVYFSIIKYFTLNKVFLVLL